MNEATATVVPAPQEIKLTPAQEARFWSRINKDGPTQPHMESPCWLWTAYKSSKGYGQISLRGKSFVCTRVAWTLTNGAIPYGLFVCHHCDNPGCVNPAHLFLGTHTDNMRDRNAKGRANMPSGDNHHARRHPERMKRGANHHSRLRPERVARGEASGNAKLTTDIIMEIRALHAAGGITQRQLAVQFGVSFQAISKVILRRLWKHVP